MGASGWAKWNLDQTNEPLTGDLWKKKKNRQAEQQFYPWAKKI